MKSKSINDTHTLSWDLTAEGTMQRDARRGSKVLAGPKGGYCDPPILLYPYTEGMK